MGYLGYLQEVATVHSPMFFSVLFHFSTSPGCGKGLTTTRGVGGQKLVDIKHSRKAVVTAQLVIKLCREVRPYQKEPIILIIPCHQFATFNSLAFLTLEFLIAEDDS